MCRELFNFESLKLSKFIILGQSVGLARTKLAPVFQRAPASVALEYYRSILSVCQGSAETSKTLDMANLKVRLLHRR